MRGAARGGWSGHSADRCDRDVGQFADCDQQFAAFGEGSPLSGLTYLIPIALGMGLVGLAAFFWAMRTGQYDDMEGAASRILIDEEDDK